MSTVYISETGDDDRDGGNSELHLMGLQTMERLIKEIEDLKRRKIYSKSDWG